MTQPRSMRRFTEADGGRPPTVRASRPEELTIPADVQRPDTEPTTFDPADGGLSDGLPERTALLCVTMQLRGDEPLFKLNWYFDGLSDESRPADVEVQGRPSRTLPDILSGSTWRNDYQDIRDWWVNKRRLNDWMVRLVAAARADGEAPVRLIVWDDTAYQIPWELFNLDEDGTWLGSVVEIVRWTSVNQAGRVARYTARPDPCVGGVLALETPGIGGPTGPVLDEALSHYGAAPKRSMMDLLMALDDRAQRCALVLVRCHGRYGATVTDFMLDGMRISHCSEYRMHALRASPAVVLLNACHSGRAAAASRHAFAATRSFAELFLRRGASGVIATVGEVDWDYSHEFAAGLLEARDEERRIAELLLAHRRHAVDRTRPRYAGGQDTREEADFKDFFQAFAYVYFGHPETTLRLTAHPDGHLEVVADER